MKRNPPSGASIHILHESLWGETPCLSRSRELTCLYVDRYTGLYAGKGLTQHTWWEMICVTQGQGELLLPDESLTLAVGSVFLIAPQVKHVEKSPGVMSIIWVGLDGTMMEDQTSAHPKTVQSDSLIPLFEEMIQISWQPRGLVGPILDGQAHVLLGSFLQQFNEPKRSELDYRLEWAAEYLRHNYARSVSMTELAQACKCSEGHFYRSFHQYFGISPRRFLETLRMKQATKLLLHSDARVEEIARDVGFDDPLYFSRAFRRFYNQSPLQIRKSLRQQ